MKNGVFSVESWAKENDMHNKIFRIFYKKTPDMCADFCTIRQIINFGSDYIVGLASFEGNGELFPAIYYYNLKDLIIEYHEKDQEDNNGSTK